MKKIAFVLLALVGCSGENDDGGQQTWGDVALAVVDAYCTRAYECIAVDPDRRDDAVQLCIDHSMYHLCELFDTCDVPVDVDVSQCVADYSTLGCGDIVFNRRPESCRVFFDAQPETP